MSTRLEIAAWLATRYTYTVEKCTLLLDNVISDCHTFFETKGLPIQTARLEVTSLIPILFHVPLNVREVVFTQEKKLCISHVKPIPDFPSSSLQLPTGCRLTTTPDKEIQIICPFGLSKDGKTFSHCAIALHWPNTILSFNNFTVSLDIQLRLQQNRIHGLISLVRRLRWCRGVTIANTGGDTKIEHAGTCERIILPLSGGVCCDSCVDLRSLQEPITNIEQEVEIGQMGSEEPNRAKKVCITYKNKGNNTEIDFVSCNLPREQGAVSDTDTQHLDTDELFDNWNIVLDDLQNNEENVVNHMSMPENSNELSETNEIFMTKALNSPATPRNDLLTKMVDEDDQIELLNKEDTNRDTMIDDNDERKENCGKVVEEGSIEEKMAGSDCQSEEEDTNINNGVDEFETLKPRSDLLLLQSSTHSPEILKTLLRMQRENKYCDFKLVTQYKTINVHKLIILANRQSFLKHQTTLDSINELHFPEVLPTVMDSVVYFLYTGKLKVKKSEISLLKSFCETEGLKGALELLHDYSDVETLSLTVEQLMETSNPLSKDSIEIEPADMTMHNNEEKAETVSDIVKHLRAEAEEECSFVTKSGRVSKPTSLKVASVLAEKKKTKIKSIMSEIESKEQILKIQKSKNFRSKETDLKRKSKEQILKIQKSKRLRLEETDLKRNLLSRHSVYIRRDRTRSIRMKDEKIYGDLTERDNIFSNILESKNGFEIKPLEVHEEFDHYHFHSYALSNSDSTDDNNVAAGPNNDPNKMGSNGKDGVHGERNKTKQKRVQYQCPECDTVKHNLSDFKLHMAKVHYDKESIESFKNLTCGICGRIERVYKFLARHMINKHGNKDPENKRLVKKETCRTCGLVLRHTIERIRHEMRQHGIQNKSKLRISYKCTRCEKKLASVSNLRFHEFHHHGIVPESKTLFYCQIEGCNYVGRDKYSLECHMQSKHNKIKSHPCEFCGKQFRNPLHVALHVKRTHTCRVCKKKIGQNQDLKSHMISEHSTEEVKPLQCEICSQRFAQKLGLDMHLYRHHDRPLPEGTMWHHCDKCKYVTTARGYLEKHRQIHEGTTVYTCEICQHAFSSEYGLKYHDLRMHKNVPWEKSGEAAKSCLCHVCSKKLNSEKLLQLHLYTHHGQELPERYTWHKCDKCSFVTIIKTMLKTHTKKVHSGSVVHTCSVCKKAFGSYAGLRRHLQKHKGVICPKRDCPVICENEDELETHMKQEHGGGKAAQDTKKRRGRPKKKPLQKRKTESHYENIESGDETEATVEFHDTDEDDENKQFKKLSTEIDITALNKTAAITYNLRQLIKKRKYQQEVECESDEDIDDHERETANSE